MHIIVHNCRTQLSYTTAQNSSDNLLSHPPAIIVQNSSDNLPSHPPAIIVQNSSDNLPSQPPAIIVQNSSDNLPSQPPAIIAHMLSAGEEKGIRATKWLLHFT